MYFHPNSGPVVGRSLRLLLVLSFTVLTGVYRVLLSPTISIMVTSALPYCSQRWLSKVVKIQCNIGENKISKITPPSKCFHWRFIFKSGTLYFKVEESTAKLLHNLLKPIYEKSTINIRAVPRYQTSSDNFQYFHCCLPTLLGRHLFNNFSVAILGPHINC